MSAQATSPTKRSTAGVQATGDAGIIDHVEGIVDEQWGGILGDGLGVLPDHVSRGDVTVAVGADGQQSGIIIPGADIDQATAGWSGHRARDDRVTHVTDPPQLVAVGRVVRDHAVASGTDHLGAICAVQDQGVE